MNGWRKKLYWAGLLIGGSILIWQIFRGFTYFREFDFTQLKPDYFLLALGCNLMSIIIQSLNWKFIMQGLGISIPLRKVIENYMVSFLPRYIPGTIWGYISRNEWLYQEFNTSYRLSNLGSILEVGIAIVSGILIIFTRYLFETELFIKIILSTGIITAPLIAWAIIHGLSKLQNSLVPKLDLTEFQKIPFALFVGNVAIFYVQWLFYGVGVVLIFQAINPGHELALDLRSITHAASVFSMSWIAGLLFIIAPSGMGIRELTLANLVTRDFGLQAIMASAISVTARLTVSLAEICWILVGLLFRYKPNK